MGRTPQENVRIAEMYLKGSSQAVIASELNVSPATISADLKTVRQEWKASRVRNFDDAVDLELNKLDQLAREAWAGWNRSLEPAESTKVTQGEAGKKAEKTVRQQQGEPRYLELVHRCTVSRRALLGLDAPTKIAPTSPDGESSYHGNLMAELMRLAEENPRGPEIVDAQFIEKQISEASPNSQSHPLSTESAAPSEPD